jgi:hypothetical protein
MTILSFGFLTGGVKTYFIQTILMSDGTALTKINFHQLVFTLGKLDTMAQRLIK